VTLLALALPVHAIDLFAPNPKPTAPKPKPKPENVEINADNISRDYETRTLSLDGHVHIRYGDEMVSCDKATVSTVTHDIQAHGNVILENADTYIQGQDIDYNYETKVGTIRKGLVESGNVIFLGEIIKKNSDKNFVATDASFTACVTCPAAWSFSGSEIEAEIGGYAYIKYPILRVADFPILILPRLLVPLKSTRQSGILVPSLGFSSTGGTEISLPYFWAISKSSDATFTLRNYQRRGLKEQIEYRFLADANSKGILRGSYINDRGYTDDGTSTSNARTLERGFLTYDQYFELPNHYVNRLNLNLATDLRYPRDFYTEMPGLGDSALENSVSITKNTEKQAMNVESTYYVNLLKADGNATNNDAVQRFPEINYSLMEQQVLHSNFYFKFDANYINFARRDFSYDVAFMNGGVRTIGQSNPLGTPPIIPARCSNVGAPTWNCTTFDPSVDQIRTGQRFIFAPSVSYPFHVGSFLDVEPRVTYQEMQYRFNATYDPTTPQVNGPAPYANNAARRFIEADISAKTKYSAVYGVDDGKSNRYKHEIEPELIYSRTPWNQDPNNVFFGSFQDQAYWRRAEPVSNPDFSGNSKIQFDYLDRFFDMNIATMILSNYLTRKVYTPQADGTTTADYFKFATFRVSEGYDFREAHKDNGTPHPWSTADGLIDIRQDRFETLSTVSYYPYAFVSNWAIRAKYNTLLKNYLELIYNDNYIVDESFTKVTDHSKTAGVGLGLRTRFLDLVGHFNYSLTTQGANGWDYISQVKLPGECLILKFGQSKVIGSDTKFDVSLNFNFGGSS